MGIKVPNEAHQGLNLDWHQAFETFDHLIRMGHIQQVVAMVSELKPRKIPRIHAQKTAHIFYRTGLFAQGLQTLSPIVTPKRRLAEPATELEIATYAILLIKIGSVQEAKKMLDGLSYETPQADLYRAFAEQAEWDYEKAIPHLRRYLAHRNLSAYEIALGEVNLAAALIDTGETQESRQLLIHLIQKCKVHEWKLIHKNCQELLGQLALAVNDLAKAEELLEEAASLSPQRDSGIFDFFIDKWRTLVNLQQNPMSTEAQDRVQKIRERAAFLRHWESVRECDRALAFALRDVALFEQVFFGTRFPAYRQKLLREAGAWIRPSSTYIRGSSKGMIFDLTTAQSEDGQVKLKAGQALHRLLLALAADFYRPLHVGQLFSLTYPNESYIEEFSEGRVSAAVSRLRHWVEANGLPLRISVKDQFYRMEIDESKTAFGLRYTTEVFPQELEDSMELSFIRLQSKLESAEFTSRQAAEALGISKTGAVRLIGWALEHGKLRSLGNNRTTRYRINP